MSIRADKEFTMVAGETKDTSAEYSGMVFCFISPKKYTKVRHSVFHSQEKSLQS